MKDGTPKNEEKSGEEREAFDRMYATHAPCVRSRLLRLTDGDREEAEDLTQETFTAAYVGRRGFRWEANPLTWLTAIARRRWRDCRRTVRPDTAELPETLTDGRDPAAQAVNAVALETALAEIDAPARRAVLLVLGHGLTYKEAADATGEPVGTVKWRVHQATRRLRTLLQQEETP